MSVAELKLKIFRKLDTLGKDNLEKFYALLDNYPDETENDLNNWNSLSDFQKKGLQDAIDEMDNNLGTPHQTVIDRFKQKYA